MSFGCFGINTSKYGNISLSTGSGFELREKLFCENWQCGHQAQVEVNRYGSERPTWVYLLDLFCSGSVLFTVESLSLLYPLFIS